jgi:hypothetical protein
MNAMRDREESDQIKGDGHAENDFDADRNRRIGFGIIADAGATRGGR